MRCFYLKEELNRKKLLEILVEERQNKVKNRIEPNLELDKKAKESRDKFYGNINNESNLVQYLDILLKRDDKSKFEYELLYFDVLSANNRRKFTGIKSFTRSIDIFKSTIELLSDYEFEKIKSMEYYKDYLLKQFNNSLSFVVIFSCAVL